MATNNKEQLFEFFKEKRDSSDSNVFNFEIPTILNQDIEEEGKIKDILTYCFEDIKNVLEMFIDMEEKYHDIISLWIIGTYFHRQFHSYPYLYINAMRGSGKTRLLGLIAELSWGGSMQNSMTEAVLFRTKGTLCIDEFESVGRRKGFENLKELLNSAYKKGVLVRRMKKTYTKESEEQVVEEFDVFRPIAMANILGIDDVLGDRCIKLIIEKSINEKKTKLVENYRGLEKIQMIKFTLKKLSVVSVVPSVVSETQILPFKAQKSPKSSFSLFSVVSPGNVSLIWNNYVLEHSYTLTTLSTFTTQTTLTTLKLLNPSFDKIKDSEINGRDLELSMPLMVVSLWIEGGLKEGIFDETLETFKDIFEKKKEEESIENADISLIDLCSQQPETEGKEFFISIKELTQLFREFIQSNDEWINERWIGRALTRLKLTKQKRRLHRGVEVIIDIKKSQEKMRMFR